MKFSDIKKFPFSKYRVDISWTYLEDWLKDHEKSPYGLDLDPPFQRGYVWSKKQQIEYVEYQLRGGMSGKEIFFNSANWGVCFDSVLQIVDGKQRINAVRKFLNNKLPVFGYKYKEFEDKLGWVDNTFSVHINNLKTQQEVVEWYIGMNTGGTIHTKKDISVALKYLEEIKGKE